MQELKPRGTGWKKLNNTKSQVIYAEKRWGEKLLPPWALLVNTMLYHQLNPWRLGVQFVLPCAYCSWLLTKIMSNSNSAGIPPSGKSFDHVFQGTRSEFSVCVYMCSKSPFARTKFLIILAIVLQKKWTWSRQCVWKQNHIVKMNVVFHTYTHASEEIMGIWGTSWQYHISDT